jgi:hypothetical protein
MSHSFPAPRTPAKPRRRANATAIAIWVFAIVEAVAIGYALWTS